MLERARAAIPKSLKRSALHERFVEIRNATSRLFEPLTEEDALLSTTADTSPPKWHLGHTTWFFERFLLKRWLRGYTEFNPAFEYFFNSYYESLGDFLPKTKRGLMSRPSLREVLEYRVRVNRDVTAAIHDVPVKDFEVFREVLEIGLHHEQQHQELLLMDVKRNFYENPMRPAYLRDPLVSKYDDPLVNNDASLVSFHRMQARSKNGWQSYPGGLTTVGAEAGRFSYDNERGRHQVWLEPFSLRTSLVTNGEFLEFVEAGGYGNPLFWLADGWKQVQEGRWTAPLYWEKDSRGWKVMTLYGMKPLDLDEPVSHVSYYEAQAFAHWKGCRLPTEFEWESVAAEEPIDGHFLDDGYWHPSRAMVLFGAFGNGTGATASPSSGKRMHFLHGTLWEWTQSAYLPYPGYRPLDFGLSEYNEKFMSGQMVLRGGSCATPRSHYRPTYRNFYAPGMRWQFSGFRLARDGK